jgi:hypothetical protein
LAIILTKIFLHRVQKEEQFKGLKIVHWQLGARLDMDQKVSDKWSIQKCLDFVARIGVALKKLEKVRKLKNIMNYSDFYFVLMIILN